MGWGRQGPHSHSYCAAQNSTGAEVLGPGWLVWLPPTGCLPPLPMLSTGTPALSYWPIPYTPRPKDHQNSLAHLKGNAGAPDQESKGRCWPATCASGPAAQQSCFQKPRLPRVQACLRLGGRPLSSHPHSHWVSLGTGSDLAWFPGGLQRLWLSSPATDQFRDLGPNCGNLGLRSKRAQLRGSSEKAVQDGK